jgi:hypothetical protein
VVCLLPASRSGLRRPVFTLGMYNAPPGWEACAKEHYSANYYLSCWYKRSELGIRTATFFAMAAIAGSFGGLLAAAISLMEDVGGRPGWAWIVSILDIQGLGETR